MTHKHFSFILKVIKRMSESVGACSDCLPPLHFTPIHRRRPQPAKAENGRTKLKLFKTYILVMFMNCKG